MSALPENIPGPVSVTTVVAPPADQPTPRHLHAVRPAEDPPEIPPVSAAGAATTVKPPATDGQAGAGARLREVFVPGSGLYTDRQPSIAETVRRAKHGGQLAATGPLRTAATIHGYAAAANKALCHTWTWIVDHPARLAVFTVLLGLAVAFPPTRYLLSLLLTPIAWIQHALD